MCYFTSQKRFADVIKLRTFRWGHDPGLPAQAQRHHKCPYKMEVGGSETAKGEGAKTREAEGKETERLEAATLLALKTEDRAVNPGAQAASRSWKRQENRL